MPEPNTRACLRRVRIVQRLGWHQGCDAFSDTRYRNVQDVEQARDYARHALRGADSGRPLAHAPCNLL
jgi:hypothetical protein